MKENIKPILALVCVIASIVIAFIALFLPPQGEIHESVLWFTSQCLLFVASLLGIEGLNFNAMFAKRDKKQ